jgi:CRP-like cAMP-binding protein
VASRADFKAFFSRNRPELRREWESMLGESVFAWLRKVDILADIQDWLLYVLANLFTYTVAQPGQKIIQQDVPDSRSMFIIVKGRVREYQRGDSPDASSSSSSAAAAAAGADDNARAAAAAAAAAAATRAGSCAGAGVSAGDSNGAVHANGGDPRERLPGQYFGEMAMIIDIPRMSTVEAVEPTLLLELPVSSFQDFLNLAPQVQTVFATLAKLRITRQIERSAVPFFRSIPAEHLPELADAADLVHADPGQVILREGESSSNFYLIMYGEVDVIVKGETKATLKVGQYFGEVGLVADMPRTATVVARSKSVLFAFGRVEFASFFNGHPEAYAEFTVKLLRDKVPIEPILAHPVARAFLRQFCAKELSSENVDFYAAVENFRRHAVILQHRHERRTWEAYVRQQQHTRRSMLPLAGADYAAGDGAGPAGLSGLAGLPLGGLTVGDSSRGSESCGGSSSAGAATVPGLAGGAGVYMPSVDLVKAASEHTGPGAGAGAVPPSIVPSMGTRRDSGSHAPNLAALAEQGVRRRGPGSVNMELPAAPDGSGAGAGGDHSSGGLRSSFVSGTAASTSASASASGYGSASASGAPGVSATTADEGDPAFDLPRRPASSSKLMRHITTGGGGGLTASGASSSLIGARKESSGGPTLRLPIRQSAHAPPPSQTSSAVSHQSYGSSSGSGSASGSASSPTQSQKASLSLRHQPPKLPLPADPSVPSVGAGAGAGGDDGDAPPPPLPNSMPPASPFVMRARPSAASITGTPPGAGATGAGAGTPPPPPSLPTSSFSRGAPATPVQPLPPSPPGAGVSAGAGAGAEPVNPGSVQVQLSPLRSGSSFRAGAGASAAVDEEEEDDDPTPLALAPGLRPASLSVHPSLVAAQPTQPLPSPPSRGAPPRKSILARHMVSPAAGAGSLGTPHGSLSLATGGPLSPSAAAGGPSGSPTARGSGSGANTPRASSSLASPTAGHPSTANGGGGGGGGAAPPSAARLSALLERGATVRFAGVEPLNVVHEGPASALASPIGASGLVSGLVSPTSGAHMQPASPSSPRGFQFDYRAYSYARAVMEPDAFDGLTLAQAALRVWSHYVHPGRAEEEVNLKSGNVQAIRDALAPFLPPALGGPGAAPAVAATMTPAELDAAAADCAVEFDDEGFPLFPPPPEFMGLDGLVFEGAQTEIVFLMRDTLARFKRSPLFGEMLVAIGSYDVAGQSSAYSADKVAISLQSHAQQAAASAAGAVVSPAVSPHGHEAFARPASKSLAGHYHH